MKIVRDKKSSTIHQIVVFGASGDLAKRKIYPALHSMYSKKNLPDNTYITGYGRSDMTKEKFTKHISDVYQYNNLSFMDICSYKQGNYDWDDGFSNLLDYLDDSKSTYDICNRLFYISLPPSVYNSVISNLPFMFSNKGWNRIIIEKPFGRDLESYYILRNDIQKYISNVDNTVYCIDHYIAKKLILDLINDVYYSSNTSINLCKNDIKSIHITCHEKNGADDRPYFDDSGIIRDIVQNHVLQIVTVLTSEGWNKEAKVKLLRDIVTINPHNVRKGQYDTYKNHKYVKKESITETYADMYLFINNTKWENIPIHINVGKGMEQDVVEIRIHHTCHDIVYQIRPDKNVSYVLENINESNSIIHSTYTESFEEKYGAYEILLQDAFRGDKNKFVSFDEIEESWRILQDVLKNENKPFEYIFGTYPII